MKKQYIIAICIIAFFTSLIITMNIVKENKKDLNIENEEILDNIENRQIAKVEENTQKENGKFIGCDEK